MIIQYNLLKLYRLLNRIYVSVRIFQKKIKNIVKHYGFNTDKIMEVTALNRTETVLSILNKVLEIIPFSGNLQGSINNIRSATQALRPPRIMVIGRTRSGKSSLINAICGFKVAQVSHVKPETGQAEWKTYHHDGVEVVRILDTRGLQEAETPRKNDPAKTPFQSIKNAIRDEYPDIILLVCKATEVNAAIEEDLNICDVVLQEIKNQDIYVYEQLSVIGVLTQCDQVAPSRAYLYEDNEKTKAKLLNIDECIKSFYKHLQKKAKLSHCLKTVIPTSADAEYEEGDFGLILPHEDYRWNIDKLIETMMEYTPKERRGSLARMGRIKATQLTIAETFKTACVTAATAVSLIPIPGTSIPAVLAIQTFMVMYIAWLSGRNFSQETIKDFVVTSGVGAGVNTGTIALADVAVKFFPGIGSLISAAGGATATQGLGDAAILYFLKS